MQMLDRLSFSLVSLPDSSYDVVLLLADTSPRPPPLHHFLSKNVFHQLYQSLRPGGRIQLEGNTTKLSDGCRTEAVLSGFIFSEDDLLKPPEQATQSVPFRARKPSSPKATTKLAGTGAVTLNLNGKRMNGPPLPATNGVGFEDPTNDSSSLGANGTISDDELIDEDTLLEEEDMQRPIVQRMQPFAKPSEIHLTSQQRQNVVRSRASDAELVRIAPVVSLSASKPKTLPSDRKPMHSWPNFRWTIWLKWILPYKAR